MCVAPYIWICMEVYMDSFRARPAQLISRYIWRRARNCIHMASECASLHTYPIDIEVYMAQLISRYTWRRARNAYRDTPVGQRFQQIWVLPGECDRYRTRQAVIILVRWIYIQLELVRCVAMHRTNTLPAIPCQRAPVQIQTRSESSAATLSFPIR